MTVGASKKLKIGVILGGLSSEREISLESGRNIFSKLPRGKYDPIALFMDSDARLWRIPSKLLMRNSTGDIQADLATQAERISYEGLRETVDLVYIALHGKYGEDGCLQGLLEILGVPYVGSGVLASALGMDKYVSRKILAVNGIDVPDTVVVSAKEWSETSEKVLAGVSCSGFPCVVKPRREGCSTAVSKVMSLEELAPALDAAFRWDNDALVEEFIEGMEVTCGVLGNNEPMALTPSETVPTTEILSLEDKFLYGQGENKTPARLPADALAAVQETARRSFIALGLKVYARIDMFVKRDGSVTVLEPNSLPGMTPSTVLFHQAAASGITPADLMDRIIGFSLEAQAAKRGPL